ILKGKAAIVTGSTSGIGRGIAHALAAEGVNIMTNGFGDTPDTINTVKGEISKFGVKVDYNPADVSKPEQIDNLIDATVKAFGSGEILVNNSGRQFCAPMNQLPLDKWNAVIATKLSSAFYTTRRAIPIMKKAGWGRIINIASANG